MRRQLSFLIACGDFNRASGSALGRFVEAVGANDDRLQRRDGSFRPNR